MSERFVLVDTSFLVALVDEKDSLHRKAQKLKGHLTGRALVFTDVVYAEAISVMSRRVRERRSISVEEKGLFFATVVKKMKALIDGRLLYLFPMVPEWLEKITQICLDSEGRLNFNDALLVFAARDYEIDSIVSFDPDFDEYLTRIG